MIRILFVCHGNICRSPMAEFLLKDMVNRLGRADDFSIESAATSSEELGNPVYPPVRKLLSEHGISCREKTARKICDEDYSLHDFIIGMDEENMYYLLRRYGGDPDGRVHNLLDFCGRIGQEIADPWYTRDFNAAYEDIYEGCLGFLNALSQNDTVTLDFSSCKDRNDCYDELSRKMLWKSDYGRNLDALYDILTGLPHFGSCFKLLKPENEELLTFCNDVADVFSDAGVSLITE